MDSICIRSLPTLPCKMLTPLALQPCLMSVDLRIICPQKTQFFAKVNHLTNIKGVIQCENYVSHWITPIIILNITIK